VDLCFEIHPGDDLHDWRPTFGMFLERVGKSSPMQYSLRPYHSWLQSIVVPGTSSTCTRAHQSKNVSLRMLISTSTGRQVFTMTGSIRLGKPSGIFRSPGDGARGFRGDTFPSGRSKNFPVGGRGVLEWECWPSRAANRERWRELPVHPSAYYSGLYPEAVWFFLDLGCLSEVETEGLLGLY